MKDSDTTSAQKILRMCAARRTKSRVRECIFTSRREIHILDLYQGGKRAIPLPTRFCQYFREFVSLCPDFFTSVKCEVKHTI